MDAVGRLDVWTGAVPGAERKRTAGQGGLRGWDRPRNVELQTDAVGKLSKVTGTMLGAERTRMAGQGWLRGGD
jgi:hypothetical protein